MRRHRLRPGFDERRVQQTHGLVEALPVLAAFGMLLAWLRAKTGSVIPGIVVHSLFNSIALIAAVTT